MAEMNRIQLTNSWEEIGDTDEVISVILQEGDHAILHYGASEPSVDETDVLYLHHNQDSLTMTLGTKMFARTRDGATIVVIKD